MLYKIKKKKKILLLMIGFLGIVVIGGCFMLTKNAKKAVQNMNYSQWKGIEASYGKAIGQVVDKNDQLLWSVDMNGYEDSFSLVGMLQGNESLIKNCITAKYKDDLLAADTYSFRKGITSVCGNACEIQLTLDHEMNQRLYDYMKQNHVRKGSVLAMDADTGAIRAAVSLPAPDLEWIKNPGTTEILEDGSLLNRNLYTMTPGSPMKIVTSILLWESPLYSPEKKINCDGIYHTSNGEITCSTKRGWHDTGSAIGVSCNEYFASQINEILDSQKEETWKSLENLGFTHTAEQTSLDRLNRQTSTTGYDGSADFSNTWSLIGQGTTLVSPVDMVKIAAGIVKGGTAPEPYLVENISRGDRKKTVQEHEIKKEELITKKIADSVYQDWKKGYQTYYSSAFQEHITVAKTGTTQYGNGSGSATLLGYIEKSNVVFFIEIADYQDADIAPLNAAIQIAGE